jgi:YidC/Oxa1 family membrane protein insertase
MLPPEVMRILLLIGMAGTGYMLIQAWNADYMQTPVAQYGEAPTVTAIPGEQPATDVPAIMEGAVADSDVPDATLLESESIVTEDNSSSSTTEAASTPSQSRLVKIETSVQNLWIDRLGGDIVRVQLPEYPVSIDSPDVPYLLLESSGDHTYVAQSGLMGKDGLDATGARPLYSASAASLRVSKGETGRLVLTAERDGKKVQKTFTFSGDSYLVGVTHELTNQTAAPIEAALFVQIKRDDKPPIIDTSFSLGPQSYLGGAITSPEERYLKVDFDDIEEAPLRRTVEGGWIAFLQHYFVSAWVADSASSNNYFAQRRSDGMHVFGYTAPKKSIAVGAAAVWTASFYAGPKDQALLESIAPHLNLTVDYGFLWWLASPLFSLLEWLESWSGNWGVAIILLTLAVKIVLYPLFNMSYKSMAKLRKVAPELKQLQERYADDRQKLSQEMMKLYQKEGANPLGGCLPMLLPMPVFLALYWVLWESVEIRQAPFFAWIQDLSAMDPYFVLPLLMGATMYLQQLMSPQLGDPMQQRMMKIMPVMFTVLFLFFPAGLVLYWLVNNVLSIAQQWYVTRQTL